MKGKWARIVILGAVAGWTISTAVARGQQTPSPAPSPAASDAPGDSQPPPAPPGGPARQQYEQSLAEFREVVAQMAVVRDEWKKGNEADRPALRARWTQLVEKGEGLRAALLRDAEAAYAEAPQTDPQLTSLLLTSLANLVRRDDYEEALRLGKRLIESGCRATPLDDLVGRAAFAVGEFDLAERHLGAAKKARALSQEGQDALERVAECKQAWAKEQQIRAKEAQADDLPRVRLKTTKGDIEVELFENEAPNTVANFISLVESGFYNGRTFHRVLPGFMAQGGCPKGDGTGGPGYTIACECYRADHRQHFRGSLSMAHAGRDTGGSQFFITFVPTSHLDGKHTVFGRVVKGFDVLAKLQRRDPQDPNAPEPDKIVSAEVLRKRKHPYQPKTSADEFTR